LQLKLNPENSDDKLLDGTLAGVGSKTAILLSHSDKQTTAERRTRIKSPFPRWAWQDGQIIEDMPEIFNTLLEKYKEVWDALNARDENKVRELYDSAAQEFAIAYHYQDKKHGHRIMSTGGMINDDDWRLGNIEIFLNKRTYKIYANGLMASIFDTKDKKFPIYGLLAKHRNTSFHPVL